MSLKTYKQKRNFNITPEPKGKVISQNNNLVFVVQKHDASHLHYDFRIEIDGVLKSWAVPKGPSTDTSVKRLAMHVEDHPYSYKNFEGIIPKGNYGAGKVIVWDSGTYEPIGKFKNSNGKLKEEYKNGSLKFLLHGKKLKGAWALFRINKAEDSWLLVKEKDKFSSKNDITQDNKSVISGDTVEGVGSKQGDMLGEIIKNTKRETPPEFINPMLATLVKKVPNGENWLYEIKWDGYRAIADIRKNGIKFYSRRGISFVSKYPEVVEELKVISYKAVLDGEIVVVNDEGKPSFQNLQNWQKERNGTLVYYVFDILYLENHNITKLPLSLRKRILGSLISGSGRIKISEYITGNGDEFLNISKKQGLEGIIAKKSDSYYIEGARTFDWLKIKSKLRQEAVICGYTAPRGGRKHFGALILGIYQNSKLKYIGHTGTGFNERSQEEVYKRLIKIKRGTSPFDITPKTNMPAVWVEPKLICEVSFSEWTDSGHMRQPVFEGLRFDKDSKEVTKEVPVENTSPKLLDKENKNKINKVKISHRNKVFWPEEGYTKGDLLDYYKKISSTILPYLKDRPQVLRRYPNGINGESFFQKDITFKVPEFASTLKIYSESEEKEMHYLLCQNTETLLYIINLGCIDLNPWNSRAQSIDYPDFLIFDLDPLDISFSKVIDAAVEIRKVLEKYDIESFPKTSGATGMHIYLPVGAKYTYDQVRQFAEIIVNIVNEKTRDFTSVERTPQKRKGKVYLDFLQNRKGQTLASPYSVRPFPKATVSTPLKWEEVNRNLSPRDFTIRNIFKRLDKIGDIWRPVLDKEIDISKVLKKLV